jgi:Tfp pilus assembly protein PilO
MTNKRAPIFAAVAAAVIALLAIFFLVLPKMNQVSAAKDTLAEEQAAQSTLESQLRALEQAQEEAPEAKATIQAVDQQLPKTADLQGAILLLNNAAVSSGVDVTSLTPGSPVFNATTGLSEIQFAVSASGTYFALTQYLYRIETLPRAAKATTVNLSPGATSSTSTTTLGPVELTLQATVILYTQDASAGPGSVPGPTTPEEAAAAGLDTGGA